jgi:hypothetical protein
MRGDPEQIPEERSGEAASAETRCVTPSYTPGPTPVLAPEIRPGSPRNPKRWRRGEFDQNPLERKPLWAK